MDELGSLNPDDPRPPYQQVANAIRAAILTRTVVPGEQLPSGSQLATRYGVSRMTIQQALRLLRDEGLVVSRQGSGVFVRQRVERPVGLRPHLERAFSAEHVSLDFSGFSGETLRNALAEPLDQIRSGQVRPKSVAVRLLVPDTSRPWSLPARIEDMADVPAFRERAEKIVSRSTVAVAESVREMQRLGLIETASAEVRILPLVPMFKVYILNESEVFFGYYPVTEHRVVLDGEETAMWDLMGKDALLLNFTAETDPDSMNSQYVAQSRAWFNSMWSTVSVPMTLVP